MRVDIILIDRPVTVPDCNGRLCLATPSVLILTVIGPNNDTLSNLWTEYLCISVSLVSKYHKQLFITTTKISSCLLNTDKKPAQSKVEDISYMGEGFLGWI